MNETVKQVLDKLQMLAEKLGTTAEHLWQVLCEQAHIFLWFDILSVVVAIVLIISFTKYTRRTVDMDEACEPNTSGRIFANAILGIVTLISTGIALANLVDIPSEINKQYFALKKILELFGK